MASVGSDPSVSRFERRATGYETGVRGRWHAEIVERTAALTRTVMPDTGRVLDVGCGSGALLRLLARDASDLTFVGVDPASRMLVVAAGQPTIVRSQLARSTAEALPLRAATFDVVVSSVSFGHWPDQRRGLGECRRVLVDGGSLVLVDVFARWLNMMSRRGNRTSANTRSHTTALLHGLGFADVEWHDVDRRVIGALVAR